MKWTDSEGNLVRKAQFVQSFASKIIFELLYKTFPFQVSEGGMLRLSDIRRSKDFVCVAENEGGRTETAFSVYVSGPGSAPENVRLAATRPKSILVTWDPPEIPNGNITRYM